MRHDFVKLKRRVKIKGIIDAIISSASLGLSPFFSVSLIALGLSTFEILSYRWGVATVAMFLFGLYRKRSFALNFSEFWKIFVLSILRALTSITLLWSFANISTGVASTIHFMYPVIVAACMMLFFGEKKSLVTTGAILLSLLGAYLLADMETITTPGGDMRWGIIASIVSVVSYAAYMILLEKLKANRIESSKYNTYMMGFCALFFIIGGLVADGGLSLVTSPEAWLHIICLGVISTMVSNFFLVKSVRKIGPTLSSVFGALEPLTAVVVGVLFLGEHLNLRSISGLVLILVTVSIVILHQKKR